jgi:hypothetical protein
MCTLGAINGRYLFKTRDLWSKSDTAEEIVAGYGRYRYVGVQGHASPLERGLNSGINEKGLAVAITYVDTVPLAEALQHKTPRGVLVEEILRSCDDLGAALRCITDFMPTPLVGGNIVIASPDGCIVLEQLYPRYAFEYVSGRVAVRTNHFLNLWTDDSILGDQENSLGRFKRTSLLLGAGETTTVESIKTLLADHQTPHPICSHSGELSTVSAFVYDLGAAELHHAAGPPCSSSWHRYEARN